MLNAWLTSPPDMAPPPVSGFQYGIERRFGCPSRHVGTVHVIEEFEGRTVWQGPVLVFELVGHPESERCYAWSHTVPGTEDRLRYAVLEQAGIDSPQAAIRNAMADADTPETGERWWLLRRLWSVLWIVVVLYLFGVFVVAALVSRLSYWWH